MKQLWFKGDIENSLFAQIWLKFIQTTQDMIDESTVDVIINYFERLFMCDNDNTNITDHSKSPKRMATSGLDLAKFYFKINTKYLIFEDKLSNLYIFLKKQLNFH